MNAADDLLINQNSIKDHPVTMNGHTYVFKIREPSWGNIMGAMEKAQRLGKDGSMEAFSLITFQRELLKVIVVESPIGTLNDIVFSRLKPEVGAQLMELTTGYIGLLGGVEGDEGKKSEEPSAVEPAAATSP